MMPVNFGEIIENAKKAIVDTFKDITSIDIVTAVAEEVTPPLGPITNMDELKNVQLNKISYYARTTLHMGGDRETLLPNGDDCEKVKEVTEIHQASAKYAVQTWNSMARVSFTGLAILSLIHI